jgi:HEAT repeat protein
MDEPDSSALRPGKHLRFSLLQLVAVTTSLGAAFALCRALFSPALGSSGLAEARLPALVLAVALWFCRRNLIARLGSYAVVASLLSLIFFQRYFAQTDWLFGHTLGPPQLVIATSVGSLIGVLAGIGWAATKLQARQTGSATVPTSRGQGMPAARWLANSAIIVLTLLSGLLALVSVSDLPRAQKRLDQYVERRWRYDRHSLRERAESIRRTSSPRRPEMAEVMANQYAQPGDEAAVPALLELARDDDPRVRRAASQTLRRVIFQAANLGKPITGDPAVKAALTAALKDEDDRVRRQVALADLEQPPSAAEDRQTRLSAIAALGSAEDRDAVDEAVPALLRVLEGPPDEEYRIEAIRALGRIGPNVALGWSGTGPKAVYRLSMLLESQLVSPAVRSEAAKTLYKIDPVAAERFQITQGDPAARMSNVPIAPVQPGLRANADDPKQLAELIHRLNDDNRSIRDEAATGLYAAFRFPRRFHDLPPSAVSDLVAATKRPEIKVGTAAMTAIRYLRPEAKLPALLEITRNPASPVRLQAINALDEMGPAAAEAVPRLSEIMSTDTDARQRSFAAKAIGTIGPAAKSAAPAFGEAWKKRLISVEDAQALYKIDPEAAEKWGIPRLTRPVSK